MLDFLKSYGWGAGLVLISWFIFKWFSDHPEYGEKLILFVIRLIPFTFSWKKRKTIEKDIQAYMTEEIKKANQEAYGFNILPKGVKIEWKFGKEEVIVEENEIIIRLGSRINLCENFVDALILYLSQSFMPNEKFYLASALYESCKFQVAISMLRKRSDEHYKVFIDKYYKPALEKYEEILRYSEKLESIEKSGCLTSLFIPVLSFYADKWIFQRISPSEGIQKEINEFLDFVNNIATKKEYEIETGEEPPLTYQGRNLNISVVLVARKELAKKFNLQPHIKIAKKLLKGNVDLLFITGRGKNASLAGIVARSLRKETYCEQIDGIVKSTFCPEEDRIIECIFYAFKKV